MNLEELDSKLRDEVLEVYKENIYQFLKWGYFRILGNLEKGGIKMKANIITTEIIVKENKIGIMCVGNINYISFDYYSLWEEINNENFNSVESHRIKIA